jgi:hypothetical protein
MQFAVLASGGGGMIRPLVIVALLLITAGCTMSHHTQPQAIPNTITTPASVTFLPTSTATPVHLRWVPAVTLEPAIAPTPTPNPAKYKDYTEVPPANTGIVHIATVGWGANTTIHINSTDGGTYEKDESILPDGSSTALILEEGNYIAYLPDKTGNMTEQHKFFIGRNEVTYVAFDAYTYRASLKGGC